MYETAAQCWADSMRCGFLLCTTPPFSLAQATGEVEAMRLSLDHKPTDPDERARIEATGGAVSCGQLDASIGFEPPRVYRNLGQRRCYFNAIPLYCSTTSLLCYYTPFCGQPDASIGFEPPRVFRNLGQRRCYFTAIPLYYSITSLLS